MAYLIRADFLKQIQPKQLDEITNADASILAKAEAAALEEARSYLVQRYNLTREFTDILKWDATKLYNAAQRVYLDADTYNQASTYAAGALALYSGYVYKCKTNGTTGAWDASKWDLLGAQYDIFFARFPQPEFDYNALYNVGANVFWNNKTYQAILPTRPLTHSAQIQYNSMESLPYNNVAPDVPQNGYWNNGTTYNVPANTAITNTAYWTPGDNRSQQLITVIVDIALFHIHSRIAPQNVPELREKRYDDAKVWLRRISKGELSAVLPEIKPAQGRRIRHGGNVKRNNEY